MLLYIKIMKFLLYSIFILYFLSYFGLKIKNLFDFKSEIILFHFFLFQLLDSLLNSIRKLKTPEKVVVVSNFTTTLDAVEVVLTLTLNVYFFINYLSYSYLLKSFFLLFFHIFYFILPVDLFTFQIYHNFSF